jgi:hypothetical protein
MSKKKILNESQIRRFMGLAGISSLTDGYIARGEGVNIGQLGLEEQEEELPLEEPMDELPAEEPALDELPAEEPMDAAPAGDLSVADVESALADALEAMASELSGALPGVELSVDSDEELPAEEPAMDELPAEEPAMDELPAEEPPGEEEPALGMSGMYEEVSSEIQVVDTDAIVKEVYRRVAKRLNKMVKDNK